MGYCASGSGFIHLGKTAPSEQVLRELADHGGLMYQLIPPRNGSQYYALDVLHEYDNYHEEEVQEFLRLCAQTLNMLAGSIEFTGEDDTHWRFAWNPLQKRWFEQIGSIEYDSPGTAI